MLLLVLAAYGLTRLASRGEVMGRVEVAGVQIGGLDEEQALSALLAVEEAYLARPAVFSIDGKFTSIQPSEAGLEINEQAIADEALLVGRNGNVFSEFTWWITHIFDTVRVPVRGSVDDVAIEEVFDMARQEVERLCGRAAEDALVEVGITDLHPELVTLVGRLRYRTSYGQNVLKHLLETAHIAGIMAAELGLDRALIKRCAFLHDIGKALTHEVEGSHALIGADVPASTARPTRSCTRSRRTTTRCCRRRSRRC